MARSMAGRTAASVGASGSRTSSPHRPSRDRAYLAGDGELSPGQEVVLHVDHEQQVVGTWSEGHYGSVFHRPIKAEQS